MSGDRDAAAAAAAAAPFDVVVVGSCIMDLVAETPRLPVPGETILGTRFTTGCGGKGANQCVQARRLGARAAMVAQLGNDDFGRTYRAQLEREGIDTAHVGEVDGVATGVAPIAVDAAGRNSIIVVAGANMRLVEADVARAAPLLHAARVVVTQLEVPVATTHAALRTAKQRDAPRSVVTVLNPAPAPASADALPRELLAAADIVNPNETEAQLLCGGDAPPASVDEAAAVARELQRRGANDVVVTMGAAGCVLLSRAPECRVVHVPAPAVDQSRVVDTTGAGDSFTGALAYHLSQRAPVAGDDGDDGNAPPYTTDELAAALRYAVGVASLSVQARGTQSSFANAERVNAATLQ